MLSNPMSSKDHFNYNVLSNLSVYHCPWVINELNAISVIIKLIEHLVSDNTPLTYRK